MIKFVKHIHDRLDMMEGFDKLNNQLQENAMYDKEYEIKVEKYKVQPQPTDPIAWKAILTVETDNPDVNVLITPAGRDVAKVETPLFSCQCYLDTHVLECITRTQTHIDKLRKSPYSTEYYTI